MSCDYTFEEISAYADGELGDDASRRLAAHLEECAACRSTLETISATKHRLAKIGAAREPTDALRRELETETESFRERDADSTGSNSALRGWRGGLLAAAALVLVLGGYLWGTSTSEGASGSADWAEMFVADHLHSRPAAKPMDISSNDPREIADFFEQRVAFAPRVPELPGSKLLGARDCTLGGHPVELIFYRYQGRALSLFVTDALEAPATCRRNRDHTVCVERRNDVRLMLVGRAPPEELRPLVQGARL